MQEQESSPLEAAVTIGVGVAAAATGILLSKGAFKLLDWGLEKVFGEKGPEPASKTEKTEETIEAEVI